MSVKKPLALYTGKIKELQAGDTISGATATVKISQVVADFGGGRTALSVTVSDSSITDTSFVMATLAYDGPATSMARLIIGCGSVTTGSFVIYIRTADGSTASGAFRINYINT